MAIFNVNKSNQFSIYLIIQKIFSHNFNCCHNNNNNDDYHQHIHYNKIINHYHDDTIIISKKVWFVDLSLVFFSNFFSTCFRCCSDCCSSFLSFSFAIFFSQISFTFFISFSLFIFIYFQMIDFLLSTIPMIICIIVIRIFHNIINNKQIIYDNSSDRYLDSSFSCALSISMFFLSLFCLLLSYFLWSPFWTWILPFMSVFLLKITNFQNVFVIIVYVVIVEIFSKFFHVNKFDHFNNVYPVFLYIAICSSSSSSSLWSTFFTNLGKLYNL